MNRRERKAVAKRLGLNKYYKSMTREQRWQLMRDNIESGKRMMAENKEKVLVSQEEQEEQRMHNIISNRAEKIAADKKIPLIDALVLAKNEYDNSKK